MPLDCRDQARGSQLKYRAASSRPARPQTATISTSVQRKLVPRKPACIACAKCLTGKTLAIHRIQDGVLLPNAMKMPDRNSSGRIVALTIAADASALGITAVIANPSAQKDAEPTTTMMANRSSVSPVGTYA